METYPRTGAIISGLKNPATTQHRRDDIARYVWDRRGSGVYTRNETRAAAQHLVSRRIISQQTVNSTPGVI